MAAIKPFGRGSKKKICIYGHLGLNGSAADGQTIKTQSIYVELKKKYGIKEIVAIDTGKNLVQRVAAILRLFFSELYCKNIIVLPGENVVRMIMPLLSVVNRLFGRKLHYIVIGGWLPDLIDGNVFLGRSLARFDYIYVETNAMKWILNKEGLRNVLVLPNFKKIRILKPESLVFQTSPPYKLCTFSRVMREKGIEETILAVTAANQKVGYVAFELDIYGQIETSYRRRFLNLLEEQPEYIAYKGIVPFLESTKTLKNYFALLFPTYYSGEGFAGTLIDAMASGVPVIASDWKYNSEIVKQNITGVLVNSSEPGRISKVLVGLLEPNNCRKWNDMKVGTLHEARKYTPEFAMKTLYQNIV